jgi:hypothetical protein
MPNSFPRVRRSAFRHRQEGVAMAVAFASVCSWLLFWFGD